MPRPRSLTSTLRTSTYSLSSLASRATYDAPATPLPAYISPTSVRFALPPSYSTSPASSLYTPRGERASYNSRTTYDSRASYDSGASFDSRISLDPHVIQRDPYEAVLSDVRGALFTQAAAPSTCRMTQDDVFARVDAAATRHGVRGRELRRAREEIREEWADKVSARRRRTRQMWALAAVMLVTVGIVVGVTVPHTLG
ncbi:hypothetical protein Q5752_006389 [Cryptotrichosporon argae]